MAFPTVVDTQTYVDSGSRKTSHSVTLPAIINADGWLLMKCLTETNIGALSASITGWTKLRETSEPVGSGFNYCLTIFAKKATGSEGGSVTVTTNVASRITVITYSGDNWFEDVANGIECSGIVGSTNLPAECDPPSLTVPWGAADNLWIAGGGAVKAFSSSSFTGLPANYTDLINVDKAQTIRDSVGSGRRELNAATEDPGVFTLASTEIWTWPVTIAIRPAGAPPGPSFNPAWAIAGNQ